MALELRLTLVADNGAVTVSSPDLMASAKTVSVGDTLTIPLSSTHEIALTIKKRGA